MTTTELTTTELTTTELTTAELTGALTRINLTGTDLTGTDLTGTDVRGEAAPPQVTTSGTRSAPYLVVGYDGSASARAALETATQLVHGSDGYLEVVYVAHLSGIVEMSAGALTGMRATFDSLAVELGDEVAAQLRDRVTRWHFQRRDGSVPEQLIAVATELRRKHGPDATVIIVGASTQLAHHFAGSVAVTLARRAGFPLLVVPVSGCDLHPGDDGVADSSEYLG